MAKKSLKKATKSNAPAAEKKQSGKGSPTEPKARNGEQQRLTHAVAAGSDALKPSLAAAAPSPHPTPAPAAMPPLASLAASWPTPSPAAASRPAAQTPDQQAKTRPVRAATPEISPAPAVKLPVKWEPPQSPGKATAVEALAPPVPSKVKVTFGVVELGAKHVWLSGEFNGWLPTATPMTRRQDGHWETTLELAPGRYQYKFIVDGQWIPDPQARQNVWNQHGTLDSVVEVQA